MQIQHLVTNSSILDFLDWNLKERERLIQETVFILEKVVESANLLKYNNHLNSFSEVFSILMNLAKLELIPDDVETVEDLYLYNVMTSKNNFNLIIFEYMREKFDKLKMLKEDYDYIVNY